MIDLSNIKTILQVAGINQLKVEFDNNYQVVIAEYVFKGKPGKKSITYQEIINSLTIGHPGPPVARGAAQAPELSELPGGK